MFNQSKPPILAGSPKFLTKKKIPRKGGFKKNLGHQIGREEGTLGPHYLLGGQKKGKVFPQKGFTFF